MKFLIASQAHNLLPKYIKLLQNAKNHKFIQWRKLIKIYINNMFEYIKDFIK